MMLLSYTIVDFHLIYDWAVDIQIWTPLTRSQCKVSDTQVTVKACGPLVFVCGGSRNFKTGGCGPGPIELLGSGDCFDAPSHILYVFVLSVENEIHIVNIVCWLQLTQKFSKGACTCCAGPGPAFGCLLLMEFLGKAVLQQSSRINEIVTSFENVQYLVLLWILFYICVLCFDQRFREEDDKNHLSEMSTVCQVFPQQSPIWFVRRVWIREGEAKRGCHGLPSYCLLL